MSLKLKQAITKSPSSQLPQCKTSRLLYKKAYPCIPILDLCFSHCTPLLSVLLFPRSHSVTIYMLMPGMWVSRPGLGLETDQDHFFEVLVLVLASMVLVSVLVSACLVLVLVLVSEGGLEQDLRLCATATLLVSKVETSK